MKNKKGEIKMGRKVTKFVSARNGEWKGMYMCEEETESLCVYEIDNGYVILPYSQDYKLRTTYIKTDGSGDITEVHDKTSGNMIYDRVHFVDAKKGIVVIKYLGMLNNITGKNPLWKDGEMSYAYNANYSKQNAPFVGRKKNYIYDTLDEIKALGDFHPLIMWETIEKEGDVI